MGGNHVSFGGVTEIESYFANEDRLGWAKVKLALDSA